MKKNSISEFELERQDFKIRLKRGGGGSAAAGTAATFDDSPITYAAPGTLPPMGVTPLAGGASVAVTGTAEVEIKAPMIGTFYRAPSPEAGNYVEIGSEVNPDTVVCIIEAMKVMNEIKAEAKGVITQIIVENAKPVEFGQPMFKIRPT